MTNEQAKEWLESILYEDFAPYTQKALLVAIQALEKQQWIPASEKMPEEYMYVECDDCYYISKEVLCCAYNEDTQVYEMWVDFTVEGEWQEQDCYLREEIAWMPLPEPYTEEEE